MEAAGGEAGRGSAGAREGVRSVGKKTSWPYVWTSLSQTSPTVCLCTYSWALPTHSASETPSPFSPKAKIQEVGYSMPVGSFCKLPWAPTSACLSL